MAGHSQEDLLAASLTMTTVNSGKIWNGLILSSLGLWAACSGDDSVDTSESDGSLATSRDSGSVICAGLDEQACTEQPACFPSYAEKYDTTSTCWSTAFVECHAEQFCGGRVTLVAGPEGACWRFSNTCTPEGWQQPCEAPRSDANCR